MIINLDRKEHLVLFPVNLTEEKFLLNAKVKKGTYFYRVIRNIYVALTNPSVNLFDEYSKYYSEYDSFQLFLYHKYPFLSEIKISEIISAIDSKKYILLKGYMREYMDYNVQSLFDMDETFVEKITDLLKAERYEN